MLLDSFLYYFSNEAHSRDQKKDPIVLRSKEILIGIVHFIDFAHRGVSLCC